MNTVRCYFTVATCNYLAYVRALASQLRRHEPAARFFAVMVDRPADSAAIAGLPFDVHFLEDLMEASSLKQVSYFYSAFELSNAVRPIGHRIARDQYKADEWAYIDSDIYVIGSLAPLWDTNHDIVLTPHRSIAKEGMAGRAEELFFLRYGSVNSGLLACRRSDAATGFVAWFEGALRCSCFNEWQDSYVDQKWLDLVPSFFPTAGYCRHPGINVGHWNFNERKLALQPSGEVTVNEQRLLAFHFSKWSPEAWEKHPSGVDDIDAVAWRKLSSSYRELLLTEGWEEYRKTTYRYDWDETGQRITREMRRAYFEQRKLIHDPWTHPRWKLKLAAFYFLLKRFGWEAALAGAGLLRLLGLRRNS